MSDTLSGKIDGRSREARMAKVEAPASGPALESPGPRPRPRKPFGSMTQKLAYPPRPGFHHHWFNDDGPRIAQAIEAGYTHVQNERAENVSYVVGTGKDGSAMKAFLMEIPQEWYDQDMKDQQAQVNSREQDIKRGLADAIAGSGESQEKFYPTAQGRRISVGTR